MVGGVMLTALLFELLDAKSGDIKTWVKGKLKDTRFINKINTTVENTITKVFSKADQFALLSGKVEKVLESLKANLSEEAFEYLANNLKKDQISDLMETVRKLEKELGSTEIKLSEAQVKKLLEGLKDGKGVDSMVAELKTWCERKSTKPTLPKGSKPKGEYAPENSPGLIGQNNAANKLSNEGYDVEMLNDVNGGNGYGINKNSNPDYLIDGNPFDCYTPQGDTTPKKISSKIAKWKHRILVFQIGGYIWIWNCFF